MTLPEASFRHVRRLTDDTGMLEHAWHELPRRDRGYTVDDNARGLLVACREPRGGECLTGLA